MWWGAETHDIGSTMGSAHISGNSLLMYWIQFYRTSVGAWTVVSSISAADDDIIEVGVQPTWYSYGIFSQNYTDDAVNIYTLDH